MKIDKSKYIARFAAEASDHLKAMNEALLVLEKNPGEEEALRQVLRSAHTIKGSSRMLGLSLIGELTHKLEDTLEALEQGSRGASYFDTVFKALDLVSEMVEQVKDGEENNQDLSGIIEELQSASQGKEDTKRSTISVSDPVGQEKEQAPVVLSQDKPEKTAELHIRTQGDDTVRVDTNKLDQATKLMGELVSNQSRLRRSLAAMESIRQESEKQLEKIANLRNGGDAYEEILSNSRKINAMLRQLSLDYKNDLVYQSLLTEELLENVSRMRMLPVATILAGFNRAVRDISNSCGKQVELIIEGEETELDKAIIEKLGEPLLHMIRNSIDHGIEMPDERTRAGKPAVGVIRIHAGYDAGSVYIDVSDDGLGISIQKLKEKALQKKLYDAASLDVMPDAQLLDLIFRPGFSTKSFITDISGRGVGLDVVKTSIVDQLKGSIQVRTSAGEGTTFHITLPLTLAIMKVLLVKVGDTLLGLMVNSIAEVLKVKQSEIIDVVDKKAIRLREKLIPVVELSGILSVESAPRGQHAMVLVLNYEDQMLGVIVDSFISEEDMEFKPLPKHVQNNGLVSGVSVTGKNDIVLVLNIAKIMMMAKSVRSESGYRSTDVQKAVHILVVDDSVNTREIERSILESYGYHVDVAADGLDGFERAQGFKYDLVVTDVEMPRMDGFSLTEKLRLEDAYKHTPIIIVSSRDKEEDKRKGMRAGANAYITKGTFEQSNLLSTVQMLVEMMPDRLI